MQNAHIKDKYDDSQKDAESNGSGSHNWLHPMSGLLILGLDWLLFGGTFITAGAGTLAMSITGFILGMLTVLWVQRRWSRDTAGASLFKSFLAGVAVGIPFPIFGTLLGGAILTMSGLDHYIRKK